MSSAADSAAAATASGNEANETQLAAHAEKPPATIPSLSTASTAADASAPASGEGFGAQPVAPATSHTGASTSGFSFSGSSSANSAGGFGGFSSSSSSAASTSVELINDWNRIGGFRDWGSATESNSALSFGSSGAGSGGFGSGWSTGSSGQSSLFGSAGSGSSSGSSGSAGSGSGFKFSFNLSSSSTAAPSSSASTGLFGSSSATTSLSGLFGSSFTASSAGSGLSSSSVSLSLGGSVGVCRPSSGSSMPRGWLTGSTSPPQSRPKLVYSSDPERDAATLVLIDELESLSTVESIRVRLLQSLMDPTQRELICWDAPIHPLVTEDLGGCLLLVWVRASFGLKSAEPTSALVPAGLESALVARLSAGFDCSAKDQAGFTILTHLLCDPRDSGQLPFLVAILRAILEVNTNGSARKQVGSEPMLLNFLQLILGSGGWCDGSSEKAQAVADAVGLFCSFAALDSAPNLAFTHIVKCGLSGAVLPRWLLTLSAAQLNSIRLTDVFQWLRESEERVPLTVVRICRNVIARVQQWTHECAQADAEHQAIAFTALTAWLRSAIASLPALMATHDYLLQSSASPDPAKDLIVQCLPLPQLGWWQLGEQVTINVVMRTQSLLMQLAAAPVEKQSLSRGNMRLMERMCVLTKQQQETRVRARELCMRSPSSEPPQLDLSPLDPCGLLSASPSDAPESSLSLVAGLTVELTRLMASKGPTDHTRELLRILVEAASSLRPVDDSPLDDRTQPFCGVPMKHHPLSLLAGTFGLSVAASLHDLGVTRDGVGHSYTTILMSREHWVALKEWLSPEYARYAMPNDWLSERVDPQIRGWISGSTTVSSFSPSPWGSPASAALSSEQQRVAEAEAARRSGEIVLGEATDAHFFSLARGAANGVALLSLGVQYWTAVHRPRIVRAVEAHLIPDLASEVMAFLTPDLQTTQPARAAALIQADSPAAASALTPSAAAASTLALSASLRALLRRAQTSVIDPAELVSTLTEIVNLQAECAEAVEGDRIAQKLADYSIVPPS